jgi:hypothetical protein
MACVNYPLSSQHSREPVIFPCNIILPTFHHSFTPVYLLTHPHTYTHTHSPHSLIHSHTTHTYTQTLTHTTHTHSQTHTHKHTLPITPHYCPKQPPSVHNTTQSALLSHNLPYSHPSPIDIHSVTTAYPYFYRHYICTHYTYQYAISPLHPYTLH